MITLHYTWKQIHGFQYTKAFIGCVTVDEVLIREGLGLLLRRVNCEITLVEARLDNLAQRFRLKEWKELEELCTLRALITLK